MPDSTTPEPAQPEDKRTAARVARDAEDAAATAMEMTQAQAETVTQLRQDLTDLRAELKESLAALRAEPLASDPVVLELRDRLERMDADMRGEFEAMTATLPEWAGALNAQQDAIRGMGERVAALEANLQDVVQRIDVDPAMYAAGEDFAQDAIEAISKRLAEVETTLRAPRPVSPATREGVPGVYRKVLDLMRMVTTIGKDQETKGDGPRFKFRGIDTVMNEVGAAMRDVGLIMRPQILDKTYTNHTGRKANGGEVVYTTCSLTVRYIFTDPDDGTTYTMEMVGEGRDNTDKATSKAASMALKYGLLEGLMVAVDDMEDSDRDAPEVTREQQAPAAPQKSAAEDAADALRAIRGVGRWPADQRKGRLDGIATQIQQRGLAEHMIEGATLRDHVVSTRATLGPPPAAPPAPEQGHYPPDAGPGEYQPEYGGY